TRQHEKSRAAIVIERAVRRIVLVISRTMLSRRFAITTIVATSRSTASSRSSIDCCPVPSRDGAARRPPRPPTTGSPWCDLLVRPQGHPAVRATMTIGTIASVDEGGHRLALDEVRDVDDLRPPVGEEHEQRRAGAEDQRAVRERAQRAVVARVDHAAEERA